MENNLGTQVFGAAKSSIVFIAVKKKGLVFLNLKGRYVGLGI
ncbi:MAG: hypothetical protein IRF11MM_01120 [Candidatus Midichloria mitochondrii]